MDGGAVGGAGGRGGVAVGGAGGTGGIVAGGIAEGGSGGPGGGGTVGSRVYWMPFAAFGASKAMSRGGMPKLDTPKMSR